MEVRAGNWLVVRGETHKVRNDECGPEELESVTANEATRRARERRRVARDSAGPWWCLCHSCLGRSKLVPYVEIGVVPGRPAAG